MRNHIIFLLALIFLPLSGKGAELALKHIDPGKKFDNSKINTIYRDSDGFIWIGTVAGLCRYDGFNPRFYYIHGAPASPDGENDVDKIYEDFDGRLWLKSHGHYFIYNPLTDHIEHTSDSITASYGIPGEAEFVKADRNRGLWIQTNDKSIFHVSPDFSKAREIDLSGYPELKGRSVTDMADTPYGILFVTDRGEIAVINPSSHKVENVDTHISSELRSDDSLVFSLMFDRDGMAWVYNTERLWLYSFTGHRWLCDMLPDGGHGMVVKMLCQDHRGDIWVARDHHALEKVEKTDDRFTFTKFSHDDGLRDNSTVTALYEDTGGTLWIGTYKQGIFMANEAAHKFRLTGFADTNCMLPRSDGKVWVGTDSDGLMVWDPATDASYPIHDPADGDTPSAITSLLETGDGTLYVGSFSRGLKKLRDGHFSRIKTGSRLDRQYPWTLANAPGGKLWVGTLNGLFLYDPSDGNVTEYDVDSNGLPSECIIVLASDPKGTLYIGTANGLAYLRPGTQQARLINEFSMGGVNDLKIDSRGLVWAGTPRGVYVYDPSLRKVTPVPINSPLEVNYILGLQEDSNGDIWVTSGGNLTQITVVYNPADGTLDTSSHTYDSLDGLQACDFNQRSLTLLPDGEVAAGGLFGINRFAPNEITLNTRHPKVIFSSLHVGNREIAVGENVDGHIILPGSLNHRREVVLGPSNTNFTVYFATDNYVLPEKTRFRYKLEGLDTEWLEAIAGSNHATYTNLSPGDYKLLVKATNNDGVESDEPSVLYITVRPPFWLTTWAKIIYAIMAIGAIYVTYLLIRRRERHRFNEKRRQVEQKKEEEVNRMKFRFITNVSHDLRTPLTLIISPLDTMIKETTDENQLKRLGLMRKNAGELLSMVNQLLDFRRNEQEGLRLRATDGDLVATVNDIVRSFATFTDGKEISLGFRTDLTSLPMRFDADKVKKIINNLLSNAFKFTPGGGSVDVHLSANSGKALIEVADTGCGVRPEEKEKIFERFYQSEDTSGADVRIGYGIGLSMVKEYVSLHGGSVEVRDNTPCGAIFSIELPVTPCRKTPAAKPAANGTPRKTRKRTASHKSSHPTILVVDDNPDMREFLKDGLGEKFQVVTAENGAAALAIIDSVKPAVIITDLMMPGMSGEELCRRVRNKPELNATPVIVLTAKTDEQAKIEVLTIGADDFITKPFSIDLLSMRINRLLALTQKGAVRRFIEPEPDSIDITPLDEKMVEKAVRYVVNNMKRTDLSVEELSKEVGMSRVHLYKKLKAVTGRPPIEFIRLIRLKRAAQLLRESQLNVSEIAYQVGFNNPKMFSKYFKEEFGILPSSYQETNENITIRPL